MSKWPHHLIKIDGLAAKERIVWERIKPQLFARGLQC